MIETLTYDGSWQGLCTCIFAAYEYKIPSLKIYRQGVAPPSLFGEVIHLPTDLVKSKRVVKGIISKSGKRSVQLAYSVFLSEFPDAENLVLRFVQYILKEDKGDMNQSQPDVLAVHQIAKKVSRERHRMKAFIRFSLGEDDLYYAGISPDFNVLPLIAKHFKNRYADQRWLIYDLKRNYGLYYDLDKVTEVELAQLPPDSIYGKQEKVNEDEGAYQHLWQQYFKSTNIAERKNTKLHLRHVPKRYWKHLPEKWDSD